MDLAARDSYIQKLTSKVLHQREPKKRPIVPFNGKKDGGPPQKKKKCKNKSFKDEKKQSVTPPNKSGQAPAHNGLLKVNAAQIAEKGVPSQGKKDGGPPQKKKKCKNKSFKDEKKQSVTPPNKSGQAPAHNGLLKVNAAQIAEKGVPSQGKKDGGPPQKKKKCKNKSFKDEKKQSVTPPNKSGQAPALNGHLKVNAAQTAEKGGVNVKATFSTFDVLRKKLHDMIEEAKAQAGPKEALSEAAQAKRARRIMERERKKRKKKEFQMKRAAEAQVKSEQAEEKQKETAAAPAAPTGAAKRQETAVIFNTVETVEDMYVDKTLKKAAKKRSVKGQLTPLSGRNYKQLLSRVEARKDKVDKLRQTDEAKARELEAKMKWTNVLYKAEGVKIKDDEDMLRAALANKEKKRNRRKKQWEGRSSALVEKMQKRQDKRRRNINKKKATKVEKKKHNARKKGRVLAEDLKKANL
ncbi:surfeit locus protein 6 isoform X2 [Syngnathus scovelli]|uniref:surfeit locus protein 6 isoform X2 n=1 Tax=Syngnathus scovelli TaxID=161590 RepID=UPI002110E5B6|nr:surfeit locus protein 6 isoform X2 [Syngnathus scovelli]